LPRRTKSKILKNTIKEPGEFVLLPIITILSIGNIIAKWTL
jgi:hypothetical protein